MTNPFNRTLLSLGFKLPAFSSLRRWMGDFNFTTGINPQIFEVLQNLFRDKDLKDKDCVLVWDEMSIKEFVEFNKSSDMFEGLVDSGDHGRKLETANEVLVFMIHGINFKWKYPISYYFSSHATTTEMLEVLVKENIHHVLKTGLLVRMGVCDMSFTNQGLYRLWGISKELPFYSFEDHKIYFAHDSPHLIKLVRNNLMKHDFVLPSSSNVANNSAKVKWNHIVSFFRKDHRTLSRMAPKLSNAHVFLKDFSKMKVKLAAQVLSYSVFAGMTAMRKLKLLKHDTKVTADFIREMDSLFDLLNISSYSRDKASRCAKDFYARITKFDTYIKYVSSIAIPTINREPDFIRGLLLTLTAIKHLALDLREEGYVCIYTRRLQQDCLENFFSAVRMKGGFCRNPSARQVRLNFRYLFFSHVMINTGSGNTENLTANFFQRFSEFEKALPLNSAKGILRSQKQTPPAKNSLNDSCNFYGIKYKRNLKLGDEQEEVVAEYLGAASIKGVLKIKKCSRCREMLINASDSVSATLINAKKYSLNSDLKCLRSDVSAVFKFSNKMYPKYALETLNVAGACITEDILKRYQEDGELRAWFQNDECSEHRIAIMRYFIRAKTFKLVQDKNGSIKQAKSWNQSRRDLRNQ